MKITFDSVKRLYPEHKIESVNEFYFEGKGWVNSFDGVYFDNFGTIENQIITAYKKGATSVNFNMSKNGVICAKPDYKITELFEVTLTKESVEVMANDSQCMAVAKALFQSIAYCETIRPVIESEQQRIVAENKYKIAPQYAYKNLEYAETPFQTCYISEEDLADYSEKMYQFILSKNFVVPTKDHCPLLMAETKVREAKWLLIDVCEKFTGITYKMVQGSLKNYNNYIEILMKTFAQTITL